MTKDVPHDKTHGFVDGTESTHRILLSIGQWASGSVKFCAHELTRLYGIPEGSPTHQGTPAFIMGVADRIEHAADVLLARLCAETPRLAAMPQDAAPAQEELDLAPFKVRIDTLRQFPDHEDIDDTLNMASALLAEVERLRDETLAWIKRFQHDSDHRSESG